MSDLTGPETLATTNNHKTPVDSSWSDPARWTPTRSQPLSPGSILKDRFIFEEEIGRGGMGTVFKARDLRKAEARDRDPYVAVKILNEELKQHPEALKALQREARKAQGIAHPNIVTVYDFDRDGADVYMVMELLEGESLDRVIKRCAGVGLGLQEALRITTDICNAMAYAHERGIVHADFKPANVFLTRDGVVKVLDFGIARAAKRGDRGEGQLTVFDPGTFSALTPAYAGCEVIEGLEPEFRDDIYSMACVVYELLTGTHPYQRVSAEEASKRNLVASRPAELSRRQWKTLQSALGFRRDGRPSSAQQLLEGLLPQRRTQAFYYGVAAAVALLLIVGLYGGMQLMTYRERALGAALLSNDVAQIESALPWLRDLTPKQRATIFADDSARAGIIKYYMGRVDATVDPAQGRYNYAQADALIKDLWGLLPDSAAVKMLVDRVSARRNDALQGQAAAATPTPTQTQTPAPTPALDDLTILTTQATRLELPPTPASSPSPSKRLARRSDLSVDGFVAVDIQQPDGTIVRGYKRKEDVQSAEAAPSKTPQPEAPVVAATGGPSNPPASQAPANVAVDAKPQPDAKTQVGVLKQTLLDQARANQAPEAVATLKELRTKLPANDAFLVTDAPNAIGLSYLRLATEAAKDGQFEDARTLATSGGQIDPTSKELPAARQRYERYAEISEQLETRDRLSPHHLRFKIWRLSKHAPAEMPGITQRWAYDLAVRIKSTDNRELATHLASIGRALFANDPLFQGSIEQIARGL